MATIIHQRFFQLVVLVIFMHIANSQDLTEGDDDKKIILKVSVNGSEAFWGNWSDWSNCSRPCGGGITQKIRECIKANNQTNSTCIGDPAQYRMCNIQDCPDGSIDFRTQQCSAYDDKLFKGKKFQWASFIHRAGECELKCMPKKEFFYITFKNKVIDGTRCNDFSNDVCVNGTCLPVGCDMQLYSSASLDACGVCRGDNSTCVKTEKIYRVSAGAYGYVDVATIPTGATNIRVKELGKTVMYISLKSREKNIINGDYILSNPGRKKYGNIILNYQRNDTFNEVVIDGPTNVPIDVKVFVTGQAVNDVSYQYYVPKSYKGIVKDIEYMWIIEPWTECTKSCAAGIRTRTANCVNKDTGKSVRSFYCRKDQKPHLKEKCNTQPCPARWYISEWAPCSKTCGRGLRTRRVHCVETIEGGNINMLNFTECPGTPPRQVESCVQTGTCPEWIVKPWSECSKTCGEGIQIRAVECMNLDENSVEEYKCSAETKPILQRPCYFVPCGAQWVAGDWSECSSKCGPGISSRHVTCQNGQGNDVPNEYCDPATEPDHFQHCTSSGPCQPTWQSSEWSRCSARCGRGRQMRTAFCSVTNGTRLEVVADSQCNAVDKPRLTKRCYSQKPCHINYYVSKWGKCSVTCGMGYQQRNVRCYVDRRIDYTNEACSKLRSKPAAIRICHASKTCEGEKRTEYISTTTTTPVTSTVPPSESPAQAVSVIGPAFLHHGDNADYTCRVLGYPKPKVTWTLNDKPITSDRFEFIEEENRLVILAVLTNDAGELKCHAENSFDKSTASIKITVSSSPKVSVTPKAITVKEGKAVVIKCNAEGSPLPRIQWIKDSFSLYGDNRRIILTGDRIIFKRVEAHDTGEYRCTAYNSAGSDSDVMKLNVESPPDSRKKIIDCFDDNTRANCNIVLKAKICGIPHYKRVCCETCNGK